MKKKSRIQEKETKKKQLEPIQSVNDALTIYLISFKF